MWVSALQGPWVALYKCTRWPARSENTKRPEAVCLAHSRTSPMPIQSMDGEVQCC